MNSNVATKHDSVKHRDSVINEATGKTLTKRILAKAFRQAAAYWAANPAGWGRGFLSREKHGLEFNGCAIGGLSHQLAKLGFPAGQTFVKHADGRKEFDGSYRHLALYAIGGSLEEDVVSDYAQHKLHLQGPVNDFVSFNDDAVNGAKDVSAAFREYAYRLDHGGKASPAFGGPKYKRKGQPVEVAVNVLP